DFGLYRVMHAKSGEITQFLDEDLLPQVKQAFAGYQSADKHQIEAELFHPVIQRRNLRPRLVRMRHQLQLHDTRPLDVLVGTLVWGYRALGQQSGLLDAGDDNVPKLAALPVKGAHVPAQAGVDEGEGQDLALGEATGDAV